MIIHRFRYERPNIQHTDMPHACSGIHACSLPRSHWQRPFLHVPWPLQAIGSPGQLMSSTCWSILFTKFAWWRGLSLVLSIVDLMVKMQISFRSKMTPSKEPARSSMSCTTNDKCSYTFAHTQVQLVCKCENAVCCRLPFGAILYNLVRRSSLSFIPPPTKFGEHYRLIVNDKWYCFWFAVFSSTLQVTALNMLRLDAQCGEILGFLPISFVRRHFLETGIAALLFRLRSRLLKKFWECRLTDVGESELRDKKRNMRKT